MICMVEIEEDQTILKVKRVLWAWTVVWKVEVKHLGVETLLSTISLLTNRVKLNTAIPVPHAIA